MSDDEALKYQEDNKTSSAMPKIIVSGFKTLKLEYFFTSGKDEVKAWTIQKGSKAPQAAGNIPKLKNAGKYRQEGKKYVVQDGDIIFFKFNVTQQPKKK
ncbi:hypothetical protein MXB_3185 [Myxobolus squamalis]|nr:hypothetical protein MXB_3185 [Myxobolus squamalis]